MIALLVGALVLFAIAKLMFTASVVYAFLVIFMILSVLYIVAMVIDRQFSIFKAIGAIIFILALLQFWKWV